MTINLQTSKKAILKELKTTNTKYSFLRGCSKYFWYLSKDNLIHSAAFRQLPFCADDPVFTFGLVKCSLFLPASLDAFGCRAGNRMPSSEAAAPAGKGASGCLPEQDQVTNRDPTWARAAEARAEDRHTKGPPWTEGEMGTERWIGRWMD